MRGLIGWLAMAAIVAGVSAAKADTAEDARKLGEIFCLLGKNGGEFGRMYLVTRSLGTAVGEAVKKNDEIAAAMPDEKPPLGDGVPFQSYQDDAPVCKPGKLTEADGKQVLEIGYEFTDTPTGNWTDRLVLAPEDGRPRIDDVLFGTDNSGDGLRKALAGLFSN
jgi:hypothetical protein